MSDDKLPLGGLKPPHGNTVTCFRTEEYVRRLAEIDPHCFRVVTDLSEVAAIRRRNAMPQWQGAVAACDGEYDAARGQIICVQQLV